MRIFLGVMAACLSTLGCGSDDGGSDGATPYNPKIDPAAFKDTVDNPLFPLVPGTTLVYKAGVTGTEEVTIQVTSDKKTILGVTCIVVRDTARIAGEVKEDTWDWYAQDKDGAVWYMGEDTKEYSGGVVTSTEGSWEAGKDGAKPGYIIPPPDLLKPGSKYRQEYYAGHAEDYGEVLSVNADAQVPAGNYTNCLQTHDYTPLEPAVNEQKYYCKDVGVVLSIDMVTGEREELQPPPATP